MPSSRVSRAFGAGQYFFVPVMDRSGQNQGTGSAEGRLSGLAMTSFDTPYD